MSEEKKIENMNTDKSQVFSTVSNTGVLIPEVPDLSTLPNMPLPKLTQIINLSLASQLSAQFFDVEKDQVCKNDIEICRDDPRIAFISTTRYSYFVLVKAFYDHPIGTIIGDEACGVDEVWQERLKWKGEFSKYD